MQIVWLGKNYLSCYIWTRYPGNFLPQIKLTTLSQLADLYDSIFMKTVCSVIDIQFLEEISVCFLILRNKISSPYSGP